MKRRQQLLGAALALAACGPRVLTPDVSGGDDDGSSDGDSGAPDPDPDPDPDVTGDPPDDPPPDVPGQMPDLELCPLAPQVLSARTIDVGMPILYGLGFVRITGETNDRLLYSYAYGVSLSRFPGEEVSDIDGVVPFGASGLAIGDIERDGDGDLVVIESSLHGTGDYLRVLPQNGDEFEPFGEVPSLEVNGATAIDLADFDGDGVLDLFTAEADGLIARRYDGETFVDPIAIDGPAPTLAAVRNESSERDAIAYQVEQIYVASAPDGVLGWRDLLGSSPALPERRLYASDLDGDLIGDPIAIDVDAGTTHASVWWGADGEWYPSTWTIAGELPYGAAADLDLDGREDLVLGGPDGLAIVFGGDAEIIGDHVELARCMTWLDSPIAVIALAIGDYDGDGFRDIAVTDGAAIIVLSLV